MASPPVEQLDPASAAMLPGGVAPAPWRHLKPSAQFIERVPIAYARRVGVMGFEADAEGPLCVAAAAPEDWQTLDVLSRYLGRLFQVVATPREIIEEQINQAYQQRGGQADAVIEGLGTQERQQVLESIESFAEREDLLDTAGRAPVIQLVNLIFFEAVKQKASDIHVQPREDALVVRMRIDGVLFDAYRLPRHFQEEVISRIKIMGRMDIAEKRLAQDGRTSVQIGDRMVDLRISSIPTSFGERVVIRLLDKSSRIFELADLGMDAHTLSIFSGLIAHEHGLLLVTGPTGSGKSTTLYGALQRINAREKNILTLEDPIEYQLEGISQTQVSDKKGMTFASGLRNVLRQDPDIIMVGEIRDQETAVMAIQSALTGHMVFSTLHTNDAPSAVTRLLDLGIEPYLVASSLVGVLAQRLVRRVCDTCAIPVEPSDADLLRIREHAVDMPVQMRRGTGCDDCRQTGYQGRVGLFELLVTDGAARRLVQNRATASEIKQAAVEAGMRSLYDDGMIKVCSGMTTFEEVDRVTIR